MATLTASLPIRFPGNGTSREATRSAASKCVSKTKRRVRLSERKGAEFCNPDARKGAEFCNPGARSLKALRQLPLPARRNDGKQRRRIVVESLASVASDVPAVENPGPAESGEFVESVVIVGAGIAGLAAAVALHRVGIKAKVLEQSSEVRASGSALTLWTNAWRAVDYLGVGDKIRGNHRLCTGFAIHSSSGELLTKIGIDDNLKGQVEIRAVERKVLLGSLASELPDDIIQLGARVRAIERQPKHNFTNVYLEDGSVIRAKVVIGCDGVNSVVNKSMGISHPSYAGQMAVRGVADFPGGHQYDSTFRQYLGNGTRAGVVPFTHDKVYWFVTTSSRDPGPKITDPNLIKEGTLRVLENESFPESVITLVHKTPLDMFSRGPFLDRWNIPGITPPLTKDGNTLAGDALHPMTPNMGQGGCLAIEDGIVLARCLAEAFGREGAAADDEQGAESIQNALTKYVAERQKRTLPLVIRSYFMGYLLGIGFAPVVFVRNRIALPRMAKPDSLLGPTLYDVGPLPATEVLARSNA